jgi:hypothetical protein
MKVFPVWMFALSFRWVSESFKEKLANVLFGAIYISTLGLFEVQRLFDQY